MTEISVATKYRVAIRFIAIDAGWEFEQVSTGTDRFTKGKATVDVHHGPSNLISTAVKLVGDKLDAETKRAGKMFDVQAWLTGVADPDHENFIRLTDEQIAKYESGQGTAKIAMLVSSVVEQADKPKAAPKPKAKAVPVTADKPAPRPKPQAKAAVTAPAVNA